MSRYGPETLSSNSSISDGGNPVKRRLAAVCFLCVISFIFGLLSAKHVGQTVVRDSSSGTTRSFGKEEFSVTWPLLPQQPASVVPEESEKDETVQSREEVLMGQPVLPETETLASPSNQANEAMTTTATTITTLALIPTQPDPHVTAALQRVIPDTTTLNPLMNCSATSQVRIVSVITKTDHYWMLQSVDSNGRNKAVGGDEFYVSFLDAAYMNNNSTSSGHPTAVAFVRDKGDGTYRLDFVTSPFNYDPHKALMGHGLLMVDFQYTCGIGSMTNHSKSGWKHCGTSRSATLRLLNAPVSQAPPLRHFKPPTLVALNNFSNVHVFGDSTMCQLVGTVWDNQAKSKSHRNNNYTNLHHCTKQLDFAIHPGTAMSSVDGIANGAFNGKKLSNDASTALIMGAGTWDLIRNPYPLMLEGPDYMHLVACRRMVEKIRERFPKITLIWRSPTAMHIHAVKLWKLEDRAVAERVRYLSTSRVERLYLQQKALMEQLNVTFLDLYEATYLLADYTKSGDALHYTPEANARMLSWLYPNY